MTLVCWKRGILTCTKPPTPNVGKTHWEWIDMWSAVTIGADARVKYLWWLSHPVIVAQSTYFRRRLIFSYGYPYVIEHTLHLSYWRILHGKWQLMHARESEGSGLITFGAEIIIRRDGFHRSQLRPILADSNAAWS